MNAEKTTEMNAETNHPALEQLDRYIEIMGTTPGGATPLQAEKLKGFVEALFFTEVLTVGDVAIYTSVIEGIVNTELLSNPFLREGMAS